MATLGLDIGGANLKAATVSGHAVSMPFPLWKDPAGLPVALRRLVGQFPRISRFAVTMTGELCDCFETKKDGVTHILASVEEIAGNTPIIVYGTDGNWHTCHDARRIPYTIAAANWHAMATFAGRYAKSGKALLVDIGSTTADLIPLMNCSVVARGSTDPERLQTSELIYTGVKRTPVCSVLNEGVCAEFFAEMRDVYVILGHLQPSTETDTADGRPLSVENSYARLARMLGADRLMMTDETIREFALQIHRLQVKRIARGLDRVSESLIPETLIISGAGEFLAREAAESLWLGSSPKVVSMEQMLGGQISTCAPAYAVAVLAEERLT